MSTTEKNLNVFQSDLHVLEAKLYHFHWFVKGKEFFRLHETFEELYEEAHTLIDDIAERTLQIGGKPLSSMSQYLQHATLEEETRDLHADDMVQYLVEDFEHLISNLKGYTDTAANEDDKVTEDMLIAVMASFEKTIWMLHAYMGSDVRGKSRVS